MKIMMKKTALFWVASLTVAATLYLSEIAVMASCCPGGACCGAGMPCC